MHALRSEFARRRPSPSRLLSRAFVTLAGAALSLACLTCAQAAGEFDIEAAQQRYQEYVRWMRLGEPGSAPPAIDPTAPQYTDPAVARRYFEELWTADAPAGQWELDQIDDEQIRSDVERHILNAYDVDYEIVDESQYGALLNDFTERTLDPSRFDLYVGVLRDLFDRQTVDVLRQQTSLGPQIDAAISAISDGRRLREDYIRAHPESAVLAEINQRRALIESRIRFLQPSIELGTATAAQQADWDTLMEQYNAAFCYVDSSDAFYSEVDDMMAQDTQRQSVYDAIAENARAYARVGDRADRIANARYAGALVELQHMQTYVEFDSPYLSWINDIHLTATGEVIGNDNAHTEQYKNLIDLIYEGAESVYFYEDMVRGAQEYLNQTTLTAAERELGEQILANSQRNLEYAAQAIRNYVYVIMAGVGFDILFMGPVGRVAGAAGTAVVDGGRAVARGARVAAAETAEMGSWVVQALRNHLDDLRQAYADRFGPIGQRRIPRADNVVDPADSLANFELRYGRDVTEQLITQTGDRARQVGDLLGIDAARIDAAIRGGGESFAAVENLVNVQSLIDYARAHGMSPERIRQIADDVNLRAFSDTSLMEIVQNIRSRVFVEMVEANRGMVVFEELGLGLEQVAYQNGLLQEFLGQNALSRSPLVFDEVTRLTDLLNANGGAFPEMLTPSDSALVERLAGLADQGVESLWLFRGSQQRVRINDEWTDIPVHEVIEAVPRSALAAAKRWSDEAKSVAREAWEAADPPSVAMPAELLPPRAPSGSSPLGASELGVTPGGPPIPNLPDKGSFVTMKLPAANPAGAFDLGASSVSAPGASGVAGLGSMGSGMAPVPPRPAWPREGLWGIDSNQLALAGQIGGMLEQHELAIDLWNWFTEMFGEFMDSSWIGQRDANSSLTALTCSASIPGDRFVVGDQEYFLTFNVPVAGTSAMDFEPNIFRVKQQPEAPAPSRPVIDWGLAHIGLAQIGSQSADTDEVVIAIIDSGIDWHHPNLSPDQLWLNPGEIPANGIDDDQNGYVDDLIGWNFVSHTNLPVDKDGHGTFVAGIIASQPRSADEPRGVNPSAKLMILRALDDGGNTHAFALARAIVYAADNGADIINLSVGGWWHTAVEKAAIDYARNKGVLIVGAAGNLGQPIDAFAPAAMAGVVAVAATDDHDARADYSNYGQAVSIAAPGSGIVSLRAVNTNLMANVVADPDEARRHLVGENYLVTAGTSFAAPFVSGVASLLLQNDPTLTPEQLERMLVQSARDIDEPGVDQFTGYGLLDAAAALTIDPEFYVQGRIEGVAVVQDGGQPALQVLGTADANEFERAWIELGEGESPSDWKRTEIDLRRPVTESGPLGIIGIDEISGSTQWTLRLIVEHENGRQREARFLLTLG